jgi:hypothetical protein
MPHESGQQVHIKKYFWVAIFGVLFWSFLVDIKPAAHSDSPSLSGYPEPRVCMIPKTQSINHRFRSGDVAHQVTGQSVASRMQLV